MASGLSGQNDTLYIKLERSILSYEPEIYLKDLGGLECANGEMLARLKALKLYEFRHPGNMVCTMTKLVEEIHKIYPQLTVVNLGEMDVIMEYRDKKPNAAMQYVKAGIICVLLFFGAAFTITAFHNDIGITDVFEKFYQADKTRGNSGNGLGLALVDRIVTLCRGEIKLKSEVGKGTEFTVSLPYQAQRK